MVAFDGEKLPVDICSKIVEGLVSPSVLSKFCYNLVIGSKLKKG